MTTDLREPALSRLFPGGDLLRCWPDQPCISAGPPERLAGLADLAELGSLEAIWAVPRERADAQGVDEAGRHERTEVSGAEVAAAHARGRTIYLHHLRPRSEAFAAWLAAIERELAIDAGAIAVNLFASRRGAGTKLHFDAAEAIVVQVAGRKRWRFARNEHVRFAPVNHVAGEPLAPELAALAPGGLPHALDGATEVELAPGSVMFLPRGTWHETETLEDSVHLDLLLRVPTWADVIAAKIRRALARHEHWRAPAVALDSDTGRAALATLLEGFNDDIGDLE